MIYTQFVKEFLKSNPDLKMSYKDCMKCEEIKCAFKLLAKKEGCADPTQPKKKAAPKKKDGCTVNVTVNCGDGPSVTPASNINQQGVNTQHGAPGAGTKYFPPATNFPQMKPLPPPKPKTEVIDLDDYLIPPHHQEFFNRKNKVDDIKLDKELEIRGVAAGPAGPQGVQGAMGYQGEPGERGAVGPQGEPGVRGAVGPQGQPGVRGAVGPQGEPGVRGEVGPQGEPGVAGPAGSMSQEQLEQITNIQTEMQALRQQLDAAGTAPTEEQEAEIRSTIGRVEEAERKLKNAQDTAAQSDNRAEEAIRDLNALKRKEIQYETDIDQLRTQLKVANDEMSRAIQEKERLVNDITRVRNQRDDVNTKLFHQQNRLDDADYQIQRLLRQERELQEKLQEQDAHDFAGMKAHIMNLVSTKNKLISERSALQSQVDALQRDANDLRQKEISDSDVIKTQLANIGELEINLSKAQLSLMQEVDQANEERAKLNKEIDNLTSTVEKKQSDKVISEASKELAEFKLAEQAEDYNNALERINKLRTRLKKTKDTSNVDNTKLKNMVKELRNRIKEIESKQTDDATDTVDENNNFWDRQEDEDTVEDVGEKDDISDAGLHIGEIYHDDDAIESPDQITNDNIKVTNTPQLQNVYNNVPKRGFVQGQIDEIEHNEMEKLKIPKRFGSVDDFLKLFKYEAELKEGSARNARKTKNERLQKILDSAVNFSIDDKKRVNKMLRTYPTRTYLGKKGYWYVGTGLKQKI